MPSPNSRESSRDDVLFYIECARKGDSPAQCAKLIKRAIVTEIAGALRSNGGEVPVNWSLAGDFVEREFG